LINARSYNGTRHRSDHRLVVTRLEVNWPKLYQSKPKSNEKPKLNTSKLHDPESREMYHQKLENACTTEKVDTWEELKQVIINITEQVVEKRTIGTRQSQVQSRKIEKLFIKQKEIYLRIQNSNNVEEVRHLKNERNRVLKEIKTAVKIEKDEQINAIVENVESAPNDAKMFKAVGELKRKPYENPVTLLFYFLVCFRCGTPICC